MGQRGPSKKPTALRILNNNAAHRPINQDEPEFEGEAKPPEEVISDPIALREWQTRAPELTEKGLWVSHYETEYAEYCLQHSLVKRLREEIEKDGLREGISSGLLKHLQNAVTQRLRHAAKFGFTPSDVSGIKARRPDK